MGKTNPTAREVSAAFMQSRRDRHTVTGSRLMSREVRALEPHIFNGMNLSTFRGTLREMRKNLVTIQVCFTNHFDIAILIQLFKHPIICQLDRVY